MQKRSTLHLLRKGWVTCGSICHFSIRWSRILDSLSATLLRLPGRCWAVIRIDFWKHHYEVLELGWLAEETWVIAVVLSIQRHTVMFDWSLRNALVARKAALSSRALMWSLTPDGDDGEQQPVMVRSWQHASQPAWRRLRLCTARGQEDWWYCRLQVLCPGVTTEVRCEHCCLGAWVFVIVSRGL